MYLRNKRPDAMARFTPDRVLLFVHGATYPASATFDPVAKPCERL